jgi:PAS domain S-box-containing protein
MLRPVLDPPVPAADPAVRRRSRLLAAFLLILTLVFGLGDTVSLLTIPGYRPPWYGYAFLLSAFLLNRGGRYTAAAAVTLAMFPTVLLGVVLSGSPLPALNLVYLAPGVLVASILLSARGTALFAAFCAAVILVATRLPLAGPLTLREAATPLALVTITAGLSIVAILHRDRIERDRQAELRDSEERLRLALEAAHVATWDWDARTGVVHWSEGASRLFGAPAGGAPASAEAYAALVHEDDRAALQQAWQGVLEGGSRRFAFRCRLVSPDGSPLRWIEAHGRVDRDGQGRPVRTRGAILDVTDRQRAEAEREALIRELEAKNAELERFTYTVSHDLKSPLVTIRGFLGLIDRDVADGRTDRLRGDVLRMKAAADSMEHLLHELLRLSRAGRVLSAMERVPLGEVAREAAGLLRARLEERRVRLEVDPGLPEVYGDRVRLVEVLQNLIENAVKFLGGQATPVVRVGARPGDGSSAPVLFVQDNGIGIEPRFHEKVFGLFDQLDPRVDGTGVGLALVKRIVEVHGGRVWIESAGSGQGTTVCLTLPPPPPGR